MMSTYISFSIIISRKRLSSSPLLGMDSNRDIWTGTDGFFNTGKMRLSYFAGGSGEFQDDYATRKIVGVAHRPPVEAVSKDKKQLNEKAEGRNVALPKEYCLT